MRNLSEAAPISKRDLFLEGLRSVGITPRKENPNALRLYTGVRLNPRMRTAEQQARKLRAREFFIELGRKTLEE